MKRVYLNSLIMLLAFLPMLGFSQLNPNGLFKSGMVLQREVELPVWGKADAGATINVSLNGETGNATTDGEGKWKVMLPTMSAGGPFEMTISDGTDTKDYNNVYIGDVWLCSGQSNMEFTVAQSSNASETIANANSQTIRQCKVAKGISKELSDELPSTSWTPATSGNVGSFTAVGYFFAKAIQPSLGDVPIGLLNISYGGSRIEAWMSEEILGYDEDDVRLANGEDERQPTMIYNKMLHPVLGFPVKGFLWYQGESNADTRVDAMAYGTLFNTMINFWRDAWGMGDLPFVWVQLANFFEPAVEDEPSTFDTWPQLRAAQSRALSLPNTAEVITIDVGDVDIHPTNKEPVGERLALATRKVAYDEALTYNGPRYSGHNAMDDGAVKIGFDHIGGGLMAKDATDGALKWFSCAGADGVLHKANAVIDGDSVVVSCAEVNDIEVIRYAWEFNPEGVNFYNTDSLPTAPFYIYVKPQAFEIVNFSSDKTLIERGQTVYLQWETAGASYNAINGAEKDFVGAAYLMPLDTVVYELVAVNATDNTDTLRSSITINVIDPLPIIEVYTEFGNVSPPNEEIKIMADAYAPAGGSIVSVDFYIDDELLFSDAEEPYETTWTATELGTYEIKGIATNDVGDTKADVYTLYIADLERVRFEAEDADLTGDATVKSNSKASGKKCADVQADWSVTFNVEVPEAGEYQSVLSYLLNYEGPKEQQITVNGANLGNIRFEAEDITEWMDYPLSLSLVAGMNTIMLTPSWGWMSFDYLDVLGAINPNPGDTTSIDQSYLNRDLFDINLSGFNDNRTINYTIPQKGKVLIRVFDALGKNIETIERNEMSAGDYSITFDGQKLNKGIYIVNLSQNENTLSKKFMLR